MLASWLLSTHHYSTCLAKQPPDCGVQHNCGSQCCCTAAEPKLWVFTWLLPLSRVFLFRSCHISLSDIGTCSCCIIWGQVTLSCDPVVHPVTLTEGYQWDCCLQPRPMWPAHLTCVWVAGESSPWHRVHAPAVALCSSVRV